jgi:hypothetical protein
MGFDDRTADRQSHAYPVGLGRVEWVEEALETLRAQSGTRISHNDEHAVRLLHSADHQLAGPLAGVAHRFDGVDDQVDDNLLQLDAIASNERQALRELRLQRDAIAQQFAPCQLVTSRIVSLMSN